MKIVTFLSAPVFLLALGGGSNAIKFVPRGYQLLDPQTGRVLPEQGGSRVNFAPPFTDELFRGSNRDARQIHKSHYGNREQKRLFPDVFSNNFYFNSNHHSSNNDNGFESSFRPHFQQKRKVIPYHYKSFSGSTSGRYQSPSKPTTYAHKKRQKNPYYGRKKRSAEPSPYTLLDPLTGRNVDKYRKPQEKKQKKPSNSFLFGIPFGIFNDESRELQENVRSVRTTPALPTRQPVAFGVDPYLSSSGIPLYKYRNKNPLGYGRKKREAQWNLIDPITGHAIDPPNQQKHPEFAHQQGQHFDDPLEAQFILPDNRPQRQRTPAYLSQSGVPLYKLRNRYPGYRG